jgi:thymidylate kinase
MLIVFIGMDGSGKSTLATETAKRLQARGDQALYLRPTPYVILQPIIDLLHKLKKSKGTEENPFLTNTRKSFFFRLWPYLSLVDNLINYYFKLRPLLAKGHVVCDRYFYDRLTGFEYYGYCDRFTSRIYLALIPRPDRVFVLDTEPEIAQKREIGQHHELDFFMELRARYQGLARQFNYPLINTTRDREGNLREIMSIINFEARG